MIEDSTRKLSKKRLGAIIEALTERIAGEHETEFSTKDYEEALKWARQKRDRMIARAAAKSEGH